MRKVVQMAWLGALRNNWSKETKTPMLLNTVDGFSAFGMLCEIFRLMKGEGEWIGYPYLAKTFLGEVSNLPPAVSQWADLTIDEVNFLKGKSYQEVKEWLTGISVDLLNPQRPQPSLHLLQG